MNLPAPLSSAGRPEAAHFQRLARRSNRDAQAWAERLACHGVLNERGTLERVFCETPTLAAFLITNRTHESGLALSGAARQRLTAALRGEFERALAQIHRRDSSGENACGGMPDRQLALYAEGDHVGLEITAEKFARFCQVTGMHSTALAGTTVSSEGSSPALPGATGLTVPPARSPRPGALALRLDSRRQ